MNNQIKKVIIDGIIYELDYPLATVKGCDKGIKVANIKHKVKDCIVADIGEKAFSECKDLEFVNIDILSREDLNRFIGLNFSIGMYAFNGCSKLREIVIPSYFTEFGRGAFRCCSSLSKVIYFGKAYIGDYCFAHCESLTSVSVRNLPEGCFSHCKSLKKFIVEDGITEIETDAFELCKSLEYFYIPKSVKRIGQTVFCNDFSLKKVVFEDPNNWVYCSAYHDRKVKVSFDNPEENAKQFMREDFDDGVIEYRKIK